MVFSQAGSDANTTNGPPGPSPWPRPAIFKYGDRAGGRRLAGQLRAPLPEQLAATHSIGDRLDRHCHATGRRLGSEREMLCYVLRNPTRPFGEHGTNGSAAEGEATVGMGKSEALTPRSWTAIGPSFIYISPSQGRGSTASKTPIHLDTELSKNPRLLTTVLGLCRGKQ